MQRRYPHCSRCTKFYTVFSSDDGSCFPRMFRLTLRQGSCRSLCFGGARRTVARGGGYCSCSCTARRFMCLALKSVARFLSFTTLCAGMPCTPCVRHAREPHGTVYPSVPVRAAAATSCAARTCGACAPALLPRRALRPALPELYAPCLISPFARRAARGAAGGAICCYKAERALHYATLPCTAVKVSVLVSPAMFIPTHVSNASELPSSESSADVHVTSA